MKPKSADGFLCFMSGVLLLLLLSCGGGGGGGSAFSDSADFPITPDALSAIAESEHSILLGWNDNSDNESSFIIERKTGGGAFNPLVSLDENQTSYSDNSCSAGTSYSYRIKAVNSFGDSSWSNIATATTGGGVASGAVIVDHLCTDISAIPESAIEAAKANLHIAYGHTSHGSQLISGMNALRDYMSSIDGLNPGLFAWHDGPLDGYLDLDDYAMGGDVGYYPQWENNTRSYLGGPDPATGRGTSHSDVNVVIWSWCGQVPGKYSSNTIYSEYLDPMTELEEDYPGITFVYMTGHQDIGDDADTKAGNQIIRDYCIDNDKVLFDFEAIGANAPDGTYYEYTDDACYYFSGPSGTRLGNWASVYLSGSPETELFELVNGNDQGYPGCGSCAHSPEDGETNDAKLNCVLKGRAAWWLWSRIAGWDGQP